MKKIIGITSSWIDEKGERYIGQDKYYFEACERMGVTPVLLPRYNDIDKIGEMVKYLDGVIFSGGTHVNPENYNKENTLLDYEYDNERDFFEINLAKICYENNIPMLGICRGHQMLNVAFGGTLIPELKTTVKHFDKNNIYTTFHDIDLDLESVLFKIVRDEKMRVNTIHSQGLDDIADIFTIQARSEDYLVESMICEKPFIVTYQFHPEKLIDEYVYAQDLFIHFVDSFEKRSFDEDFEVAKLNYMMTDTMLHYVMKKDEFTSLCQGEKTVFFTK